MRNLKPLIFLVFFFALVCERISFKTHRIKNRYYRTGKYTVFRRVRASFSPEILQAGAVKGLITSWQLLVLRCGCQDIKIQLLICQLHRVSSGPRSETARGKVSIFWDTNHKFHRQSYSVSAPSIFQIEQVAQYVLWLAESPWMRSLL